MPWFLPLMGLIQGMSQQGQQSQLRQQMLDAMKVSPEEEAGMRTSATANVKSALSRRGIMDSGILGSSIAGIEPEIARIKGQRAAGGMGALSGMYQAGAQQPSFLGSLMPLMMKYGLKGFGGEDWLAPDKTASYTA